MISRSFGLNIGGAIGLALYLSQAISVAFYVIAFTVACRDLLHWADVAHGVAIDPMWVNLGVMALLTVLMVGKGANLGVKALYIVVVLLFSALVLFFLGSGPGNPNLSPLATIPDVLTTASGETVNRFSFFEVFTFIFPAFTGIAAGLARGHVLSFADLWQSPHLLSWESWILSPRVSLNSRFAVNCLCADQVLGNVIL